MSIASRFSGQPVMVAASSADWLSNTLASVDSWLSERKTEIAAGSDDDFWKEDSWTSYYRPYNVQNGVLFIPVNGVLLNNFPYAVNDWATGYEYIEAAYNRGAEDASVQTIAFVIASHGGVVAGNFDMVDRMFAAKKEHGKRVVAIANEHAFSAAYSVASVADVLYVPRTGEVGSIGVVTSHMDVSNLMESMGYKITFIFAGDHKVDGNPYEALSDAAKDWLQNRIDAIYQIFVRTVARNRGLEESAVQATEARVYGAEQAVGIGLADQVMSVEEALDLLISEPGESSQTYLGENTMTDEVKEEAAPQATAQVDEGKVRCEERTRCKEILASEEAKGREDMAKHLAFSTEMSSEDAVAMLATAPKAEPAKPEQSESASASAFQQAMADGNPEVGADEQQEGQTDTVAGIISDWKGQTGRKQ